MNKKIPEAIVYSLIVIIAGLLFIPFLGGVHLFDWDEINFAESAREMIVTGDYSTVRINFDPFWEKPPLFIWMQVLSMKLFGINEFASRFPNAICGIMTLVILYSIGRKLHNRSFGIIWVLTYAGSLLPFLYFKSGIIDPWFNLFIFLSIYYMHQYLTSKSGGLLSASLSGFLIGLAILTKGPVALLVLMLVLFVYLIMNRFRGNITCKGILLFTVFLVLTGGFWFLIQIFKGNFSIVAEFVEYQIRLFKTRDAGHGGFLFYHFVVLFVGVFPASVFAIPSLFSKSNGNEWQSGFTLLMKCLFWVVLILFTIVKTKIVHYSSLCYLPLTFLAAVYIYRVFSESRMIKPAVMWITVVLGLIYGFITALVPYFDRLKQTILAWITVQDEFALACIHANGGWKGYEGLPALILIAGILFLWYGKTKRKERTGVYGLFVCSCLYIYLSILFLTPRIERYSQYAAIEFLKSVSQEDAYIETLGFKSYAHFFYGQRKPVSQAGNISRDWLLKGNVDKKVYAIIKADKKERFLNLYPALQVLYEKNGYVFCMREIP